MAKELNLQRSVSQRTHSNPLTRFDPNDAKYRNSCCHYKAFTLGFGIFEIFVISFILAGIIPAANYKNCPPTKQENGFNNETRINLLPNNTSLGNSIELNFSNNSTKNLIATKLMEGSLNANIFYNFSHANRGINLIRQIDCLFQIVWVFWAVLQILAVLLMFYAIKRKHWKLMIPHIMFRFLCACSIIFLEVLLIMALFDPPPPTWNRANLWALIIIFAFIFFWVVFLLKCQIYCCEFLKLSTETGYSVSRIVGPPNLSLTDPAIPNARASALNEHSAPPQLFIAAPKHLTTTSVIPIPEKITIHNNNSEPPNLYAGIEIKRVVESDLNTRETGFSSPLPPLRHTFKTGKYE